MKNTFPKIKLRIDAYQYNRTLWLLDFTVIKDNMIIIYYQDGVMYDEDGIASLLMAEDIYPMAYYFIQEYFS